MVFGEGLQAGDIRLIKQGNDLRVEFTGTTETLTIRNWFQSNYYRIERFEFVDGSVLSPTDLEGLGIVSVAGGGSGNDTLSGSSISVTNDEIYGYEGNDLLRGYDGDDSAYGGAGNDTVYGGDGNDAVYGEAGPDILYGEKGQDVLVGGDGNDSIYGGNSNDVMAGGAGADYLEGGSGSDTYQFSQSGGGDTINNYDTSTSSTDTLTLLDANRENIWFSHSGNNLVITVAGTTDQVTVTNWYGGTSYQLDTFTVSGCALQNTAVDQLVSAMAAYAVPYGAGNDIPQAVQDALAPVISATWQPGA